MKREEYEALRERMRGVTLPASYNIKIWECYPDEPEMVLKYNKLEVVHRLKNKMCSILISYAQDLRSAFDRPIIIHSGFRTPDSNRVVGGRSDSMHLLGRALDIEIVDITAAEVQEYIKRHFNDRYPDLKGLGCADTFTHIDTRFGNYVDWVYN